MTNLFKHGLAQPHVVMSLYSKSIKDTIKSFGIPDSIVKQVFGSSKYYAKVNVSKLSDEDISWYRNLSDSCDKVELHRKKDLPLPLINIFESGKAIREYRNIRNLTKTIKEGLVQRAKQDAEHKIHKVMSQYFPRATNDRCVKVVVGNKDFAKGFNDPSNSDDSYQPEYIANFGFNWVNSVYNKGFAIIQSGKRKVLTVLLKPDPYKYLAEDGIDCYKGSFLDMQFKHRGRGKYGYVMKPTYLHDYCMLVKETDDGKVFGIGQDICKAESLLERRQNAKVMKSLMESEH